MFSQFVQNSESLKSADRFDSTAELWSSSGRVLVHGWVHNNCQGNRRMAGLFRVSTLSRWSAVLLFTVFASVACAQDATPIYPQGAPGVAAVGNPDEFLKQLNTAIDVTSRRDPTANVHTPWQIFHGVLALRKDFQLKLGDQKVNAIEWIATSNPQFDNQPLLMATPYGGKFHPFTRPYAFEGHPAQFLALLSESDLPVTFAFKAGPATITIEDMLRNTMADVNDREEITWVLWALTKYLKTDATWQSKYNEAWSMERLVEIQTRAVVESAPCGGNHGLYALARVRDKHVQEGQSLRGTWMNADQKVKRYIEIARSVQNTDGSFSSEFYKAPGYSTDLNTRLNTTGHTLEFLAAGLAENRLKEPWVERAVAALSKDLIDNRRAAAECGPLYHSLNSLIIYRGRVYPKQTEFLKPVIPNALPANPDAKPAEIVPATAGASGADAASAGPAVRPKTAEPAVAKPPATTPEIAEPPADALYPVRVLAPAIPEGIKPVSSSEDAPPPSRPVRAGRQIDGIVVPVNGTIGSPFGSSGM